MRPIGRQIEKFFGPTFDPFITFDPMFGEPYHIHWTRGAYDTSKWHTRWGRSPELTRNFWLYFWPLLALCLISLAMYIELGGVWYLQMIHSMRPSYRQIFWTYLWPFGSMFVKPDHINWARGAYDTSKWHTRWSRSVELSRNILAKIDFRQKIFFDHR